MNDSKNENKGKQQEMYLCLNFQALQGKNWTIVREFENSLDADGIRKGDEWSYFYSGVI